MQIRPLHPVVQLADVVLQPLLVVQRSLDLLQNPPIPVLRQTVLQVWDAHFQRLTVVEDDGIVAIGVKPAGQAHHVPDPIVDVAGGALQTIFQDAIALRSHRGLDLLVVFLGPLELFLEHLVADAADAVLLLEETLNSFLALALVGQRADDDGCHCEQTKHDPRPPTPPWQQRRYRVGQKVCQQDGAGKDQGVFDAEECVLEDGTARLALDGITNGILGHE